MCLAQNLQLCIITFYWIFTDGGPNVQYHSVPRYCIIYNPPKQQLFLCHSQEATKKPTGPHIKNGVPKPNPSWSTFKCHYLSYNVHLLGLISLYIAQRWILLKLVQKRWLSMNLSTISPYINLRRDWPIDMSTFLTHPTGLTLVVKKVYC